MMKVHLILLICLTTLFSTTSVAIKTSNTSFISGKVWLDTNGKPINAHGGGILFHNGVYYWYGEFKSDSTYRNPNPNVAGWECYRTDAGGVSCYSSKNLYNWKFEGVVLVPDTKNKNSDIHPSKVMERPKVIYNKSTKKFVMWLHIDSDDYWKASSGCAVSDSPIGPFNYIGSIHPNNVNSRDMTLFKDDDDKAYLITSSEGNATLYISLLTDDYMRPTGTYTRNFPDKYREAPAIFKSDGKYYLITSGCTGWDPNEAEYAVADSILGKWTVVRNPCKGKDAEKTFYAQSTYILPIQGKSNNYIAMFDKWNKTNLIDSRYVWLPVQFTGDSLEINWMDEWKY